MKYKLPSNSKNYNEYIELLTAISKISGLFSDSPIPYINYRIAENIFCKSFNAENLSRSDTAFDAKIKTLGIGLKTFTCPNLNSFEKVAEFNSVSNKLKVLSGKNLALAIANFRNDRINFAKRTYNISESIYHIVARKEKELLLYETDYCEIDFNNISSIKESKASLQFEDGNNSYLFNYSKNTLFRRFETPFNAEKIEVDILTNPYNILFDLIPKKSVFQNTNQKNKITKHRVILPLYGILNKKRHVFEASGLNQWNAGGRKRDMGEIYIPIPAIIHRNFPGFFPERDVSFDLLLPSGEILNAKVCQDNSKALMTNPNNALSEWLLRKVLNLQIGELVTINKLDSLGFDSVVIIKEENSNYSIDICKTGSFEEFMDSLDLMR